MHWETPLHKKTIILQKKAASYVNASFITLHVSDENGRNVECFGGASMVG
jgi:hypothetical protein